MHLSDGSNIEKELNLFVDEISKYDIHDVIIKISSLNLLRNNQNKSIIFDALISCILSRKIESYSSKNLISMGKFKKIMVDLNKLSLAKYIDPPENMFIQNVIFDDNYKIFNGIDKFPAYNLQKIIDVLFYTRNDFSDQFLEKIEKIIKLVLTLSNNAAEDLEVVCNKNQESESNYINVPNSNVIKANSNLIAIDYYKFASILDYDKSTIEKILISFDQKVLGSVDRRPFYSCPFLFDETTKNVIILNVAILPIFLLEYIFNETRKINKLGYILDNINVKTREEALLNLSNMGHKVLKELEDDVSIVNLGFYSEKLVSVYDNEIMLVIFLCEDEVNSLGNSSELKSGRYSKTINSRITEIEKIIRTRISLGSKIYLLIIVDTNLRNIDLQIEPRAAYHEPLFLDTFSLKCIRVNEKGHDYFLPQYIKAKNEIIISNNFHLNEIDAISIYVERAILFIYQMNTLQKN